ncbi:MAG: hypothetical protein FWH40_03105 [Coriobacteriia bacterium]|nr:hypothetical protein [Coriobacteriia bacterium]
MTKRIVTVLLVFMMAFAVPGIAFADPGNNNGNGNNGNNGNGNNGNNGNQSSAVSDEPLVFPLHQKGPIVWTDYREGDDFGLNEKKGETAQVPGYNADPTGLVFWHFVNPDKLGGYANITFQNACGDPEVFYNVEPYKNEQHFGVVTPQSWVLLSAEYHPDTAPKKGATQFNLSHTAGKVVKTGSLKVSSEIGAEQSVFTYQEVWQKTFQPVRQQTWEQNWKPVYKREVKSDGTKTLVSLANDGGGYFNNGHSYIAVNVECASEHVLRVPIADSSNAHTTIGYNYLVHIEGDFLTVYFDDNLISANVGVQVFTSAPDNFPNAPKHSGSSMTVALPEGYGDVVYVQIHNEGGITWYGGYTDEVIDYVPDGYTFVCDSFVRSDEVCDKYVYTQFVGCEAKTDFDITLYLTVEDANGNPYYDGSFNNYDSITLDGLLPGEYTCALTITIDGVVIETLYEVATVSAGNLASVSFFKIEKLCPQIVYIEKTYMWSIILWPIYLKPIYLNTEKPFIEAA